MKPMLTGREAGEYAKLNGAKSVRECPTGMIEIEGKSGKTAYIPSGHLKPRQAFHIGVLLRWLLGILVLLATFTAATGGGLSTLIK